ncbi:sensor histidine kinase [Bacteroidota bacterium]
MNQNINTLFLPATRSTQEEILHQYNLIDEIKVIKPFMDYVPVYILILNMNREIVFANRTFLNSIGHDNISGIIGKRPGEALDCVHAFENVGGCGTTEFCSVCGAANAILESQNSKSSIKECRITAQNSTAFDFQVWANPLNIGDNKFTLFAVQDISNKKRRRTLERIFFHDILNTAGGLKGFIELLNEADPSEMKEFINISYELSEKLIEEIISQQELLQAENEELAVNSRPFSTHDILKEVRTLFVNHYVAKGKIIQIDKNTCDELIITDKNLLRRVIINLCKNALEAVNEGDTVIMECMMDADKNTFTFSIHNSTYIPREIQLQIFQRSFSTKGNGRGVGTYSIKLLTEKYLKGSVYFTSDLEKGTTFYITYPKKLT